MKKKKLDYELIPIRYAYASEAETTINANRGRRNSYLGTALNMQHESYPNTKILSVTQHHIADKSFIVKGLVAFKESGRTVLSSA